MDFDFALSLQSTSDGRVVAVGGMPDGAFAGRVTDNGTEWEALRLPDGIAPLVVDAAGDRWAIIGERPDDSAEHRAPADVFGRVFISDDHGATWTEATLAAPPDDPLPKYATRSSRAIEVLISGDQVVVAVLTFTSFDVEALLIDGGHVPADMQLAYWQPDEDALTFWLRDPEQRGNTSDDTEITLSYDEFGLSAEQAAALKTEQSDARIRLFTGDGRTLAHTATFGGADAAGSWTGDGFVLLLRDSALVPPEPRVQIGFDSVGVTLISTPHDAGTLTSADGRAWRPEPLSRYDDGARRDISVVDAHGTVWSSWRRSTDDPWTSIRMRHEGQALTETARFEGISAVDPLAVGNAGLAAVAWPAMPDSWSFRHQGRVAKNGYELRYDEPAGGLTLWNISADAAVYEFASMHVESPEGTRQQGTGESYSLTFLDPETGDELVVFTASDLEPVRGRCWWTSGMPGVFSSAEGFWAGTLPELAEWVGWSPDGADWGWQSAPEAFDQCHAGTDINLAVGNDFVVAMTNVYEPPPPSNAAGPNAGPDAEPAPVAPPSSRWFIARLP